MILISDDENDYLMTKGGGRAVRLDRRRPSRNTLETQDSPTKPMAENILVTELSDDPSSRELAEI